MTDKQPCPDHGGTGTKKKCPACSRERSRRYREKNRDKIAEKNRRYRQENREYLTARGLEHRAAKNRASQYLATNSGKPWTPQEVAKMQRLRRQGLSRYEIATELGRTYNAVNRKLTQENVRN